MVIREAEPGEMGVDDDEDEDDKEDIGDVASGFPDEVDGRFVIVGNWFDDEQFLDEIVDRVDGASEEVGDRANEPTNGADLVVTGGFGVVGIIGGIGICGDGIGSGGRCGGSGIGIRGGGVNGVGINWGSESSRD